MADFEYRSAGFRGQASWTAARIAELERAVARDGGRGLRFDLSATGAEVVFIVQAESEGVALALGEKIMRTVIGGSFEHGAGRVRHL